MSPECMMRYAVLRSDFGDDSLTTATRMVDREGFTTRDVTAVLMAAEAAVAREGLDKLTADDFVRRSTRHLTASDEA